MRRFAAVFLCLVFAVCAKQQLCAQNYLYATGNPSFSTQIPIENGFINVNNGEVHIEIPLATHTQRGKMQLNERLVYDSRIWKIVNNGGYWWEPTNVSNSMGGWRLVTGAVSNAPTYQEWADQYGSCGPGQQTLPTEEVFANFAWTDPQGTNHLFDAGLYQSLQIPCSSTPSPAASAGWALDGSGYYMTIAYDPNIEDVDVAIFDSAGTQVYPTVQDSNGNYFSTDNSGNLVDTLGRTPVITTTSGNEIYYDVLTYGGGRARYTVTTQPVYFNPAFGQSDVSEFTGSFTAIQSIQLPNGSSYSFTYDSGTASGNYGELTSVTLPTGGVSTYTYSNFLDSFQNQNRWLASRIKDGGTTTFTPHTISNCTSSSGCQEQTTVTSPDNNDTVYSFTLDAGQFANANSWNTGIAVYQGSSTSGGTELRSVSTTYTYSTINAPGPTGVVPYTVPATITSVTSLPEVGLSTQTKTTLDSIGANPVTVAQWDFYSGSAPSSPTEQTNYTSYYGANGAWLPAQVSVTDGSGNLVSRINYGYDETTGAGHAALVTTSGLNNHNSVSGNRGNVTTVTQTVDSSGTILTKTATYDDAGALLTSFDPNGKATYGYDSTDTFVTSTTPPTPSSGITLSTSASYDFSSGLMTASTDANGQQTTYHYDSISRPQEIDFPDGGKTTFGYPSPTQSSVHRYQTSSVYADSETQYDSYGRLSRVAVANGQSSNPWYQTDTCYDSVGRVSFTSYQYQGNEWTTPKVCSGAGDAVSYDALSRVGSIVHADNTSISYSYQGRAQQTTDENGVKRISQLDALGRQTALCEVSSSTLEGAAPSACGLDIAGTGFATTYAYSLANHSTTITQGAQTRIFQTDAVGRTIYTKEPEAGVANYSYAYNGTGLLVTRTRPQANQTNPSVLTTTTSQYDSLARLLTVTYSDGTPQRYFAYDSPSGSGNYSIGRMTVEAAYANGVDIAQRNYQYDIMGRVSATLECVPDGCEAPVNEPDYNVLRWYGYDLASNMTTETYASAGAGGSPVSLNYGYNVAGQLTSVSGGQNNGILSSSVYSVQSIVPAGSTLVQYGNGLYGITGYDAVNRINLLKVCGGGIDFSLYETCSGGTVYYWGSRTTVGNQVKLMADSAVGEGSTDNYDEFGRLSSQSYSYGWNNTSIDYAYDRYGNRWQQNVTQGSGPQPTLSFDDSTNHITASGYVYDAVGNVIADGFHSYSYDGENNLISIDGGSTATFVYDALNERVKVSTSSGTQDYGYDLSGRRSTVWTPGSTNMAAVQYYAGSSPVAYWTASDGNIHFEHQDWVGTERIRTSSSGTWEGWYSSLPFGDNMQAEFYTSDTNPGHFAMLDQDVSASSGLSHATFREYSSTAGRWMSPDPYSGSYDPSNPQSFNRYAYVLNEPMSLTDPAGMDPGLGAGASTAGGCVGAALTGGAYVGADAACLISILVDVFDRPSFHGSLKPRPNAGPQIWTQNDTFGIPYPGIGPAIGQASGGVLDGLPNGGCEFGACGGSSNLQAAAAALPAAGGAVACVAAEPCGAIAGAAILIAGAIYEGSILKGRTNVADTGITNEAIALVQSGKFRNICDALAFLQATTTDSARLQKIKATQKAFGCRRNSTQR